MRTTHLWLKQKIVCIYICIYGTYVFCIHILPYLCTMQYFYMYASNMLESKRKAEHLKTNMMEMVTLLKQLNNGRHSESK